MVTGLNIFRDYFADDTDKYVLIGGAACDIVFTSNDATFRATKDLDMVLIVEALSPEFGEKFWKFIDEGGYGGDLIQERERPDFEKRAEHRERRG